MALGWTFPRARNSTKLSFFFSEGHKITRGGVFFAENLQGEIFLTGENEDHSISGLKIAGLEKRTRVHVSIWCTEILENKTGKQVLRY